MVGDAGKPNGQIGLRTDPNTGLITVDPSHELYVYPSYSLNNALVSTLLDGTIMDTGERQ